MRVFLSLFVGEFHLTYLLPQTTLQLGGFQNSFLLLGGVQLLAAMVLAVSLSRDTGHVAEADEADPLASQEASGLLTKAWFCKIQPYARTRWSVTRACWAAACWAVLYISQITVWFIQRNSQNWNGKIAGTLHTAS